MNTNDPNSGPSNIGGMRLANSDPTSLANNGNSSAPTSSNSQVRQTEYNESGSVVGYIPDDVSSVHSAAINNAFPSIFSGFTVDSWPSLPGKAGQNTRHPTDSLSRGIASGLIDTDHNPSISTPGHNLSRTNSADDQKSALSSMGHAAKDNHFNQSDRLKRYVESSSRNSGLTGGVGRIRDSNIDDDARSISKQTHQLHFHNIS